MNQLGNTTGQAVGGPCKPPGIPLSSLWDGWDARYWNCTVLYSVLSTT